MRKKQLRLFGVLMETQAACSSARKTNKPREREYLPVHQWWCWCRWCSYFFESFNATISLVQLLSKQWLRILAAVVVPSETFHVVRRIGPVRFVVAGLSLMLGYRWNKKIYIPNVELKALLLVLFVRSVRLIVQMVQRSNHETFDRVISTQKRTENDIPGGFGRPAGR